MTGEERGAGHSSPFLLAERLPPGTQHRCLQALLLGSAGRTPFLPSLLPPRGAKQSPCHPFFTAASWGGGVCLLLGSHRRSTLPAAPSPKPSRCAGCSPPVSPTSSVLNPTPIPPTGCQVTSPLLKDSGHKDNYFCGFKARSRAPCQHCRPVPPAMATSQLLLSPRLCVRGLGPSRSCCPEGGSGKGHSARSPQGACSGLARTVGGKGPTT